MLLLVLAIASLAGAVFLVGEILTQPVRGARRFDDARLVLRPDPESDPTRPTRVSSSARSCR